MIAGLRQQMSPEWMSSDVSLLMWARASMSVGRSLAGVIVPIYLAKNGFSSLELGALFAVVGIASAIMSASTGLLAERFGRKPFIVAVPLLAAVAAIAYTMTTDVVLLFAFAALGSFGRGAGAGGGSVGPYQPAEQALVADVTPAEHRNAVFGRLAFYSSLGALVGGLVARIPDIASSLGFEGNAAYDPAFLAMAAVAVLAAALAVPVRDSSHGGEVRAPLIRFPRKSWPFLLKLWVTNSVNGVAVGFVGPFLTYWFYKRYGAGPGTIGLMYAFANLLGLFSNLGAASAARGLGLVRAIVVGRTVQAGLLAVMVLMPTFWLASVVYLVRIAGQRVAMPLRQSYTLGMVPPEERSAVAGLSNLPSQATSASGPPVAGYLFDHAGLTLPFEVAAMLYGVNTLLFYVFFRNMRPPEEAEEPVPAAAASAAPTPAERGPT